MSSEGVDEPGWDVSPEDEIAPVVEATGRQVRLWREAAGMRVIEFGQAIGYGEDLIRKVERGARIPRAEFLDRADEVLNAGGHLKAFKEDMEKARYPKKVRELKMLEERAVELGVYESHSVNGLLQTEGHSRAVFEARQPPYSQEEVERAVAARMARKSIFERSPAPALSFVQEEVAIRRPIGGTMEWRRQLEHLLEMAQLRNVTLQVMPTNREAHPGLDGRIHVLRFGDGTAVGRSPGAFSGRPVSDPRQLRILELRYGMIRAQALTPGESLAFIEQVLGET
ncbi:helix-turn-helix domain-containing protein [Streptomyces sporangiiformans]|uniref:Helix-turn-helix domain-containing protein n=1 Tax=Streptomyces sporangiiformans TaxID=2315329 RepID=A0A505DLR7_9ACTN|nr:helix-turn-helix transcriptional regulator [Streptomyces sporangiiformans]TPQ19741.1 helix-turn-helix domain-containing protein [Streptomyces sporangiiformans]